LKLDAEDLEVAGLGGYALGAAGDDDSNDRQVRLGGLVAGAVVSVCGFLSGGCQAGLLPRCSMVLGELSSYIQQQQV
jgi:hypothetical protein